MSGQAPREEDDKPVRCEYHKHGCKRRYKTYLKMWKHAPKCLFAPKSTAAGAGTGLLTAFSGFKRPSASGTVPPTPAPKAAKHSSSVDPAQDHGGVVLADTQNGLARELLGLVQELRLQNHPDAPPAASHPITVQDILAMQAAAEPGAPTLSQLVQDGKTFVQQNRHQ